MEKERFNYKSKINYDDFVQYAKLNKILNTEIL